MSTLTKPLDLAAYAIDVAQRARNASRRLATIEGAQKTAWLQHVAVAIRERAAELVSANAEDIARADEFQLTAAAVDRLRLTPERLDAIAAGVEQVALLADPVGEVIQGSVRPNGLRISQVRVPLGVVFFIYESRPNVTVDAASLCVKSGNAVILRGGKEAFHSNQAFHQLLADSLEHMQLPRDAVQLVATTDREAVGQFLSLSDWIDVTIPRGGKSLIERVAREAQMPVIKHFDGICHTYVDSPSDLQMAVNLTVDGKCQRPGVCNATETLLVHQQAAAEFLPSAAAALTAAGVELRCCPRSQPLMPGSQPATEEDYRTEYLELKLSVKVVDDLQAAIDHINEYGSHHTDCIVTESLHHAAQFTQQVDSAAVHVNASTRFNDGAEFGLGAEIGISTDKFHARGPCGLKELTSYKYVVHGRGQTKGATC